MRRIAGALLLLPFLWACEDEIVTSTSSPAADRVQRKKEPDKKADASKELPPPRTFTESDFVESDRSRDPFRDYVEYFLSEGKGSVRSQREVVLQEYSIDDLKLVGIVTRLHPARAMVVDPAGIGHIIVRGQYIGRPQVVQIGGMGGTAYEVNWQVDRIRDGDVVLVREDPTNPDVPAATRVIPLRTEEIVLTSTGEIERTTATSETKSLDDEVEALKRRLDAMSNVPPAPAPTVQIVPAAPEPASPKPGSSNVVVNPSRR